MFLFLVNPQKTIDYFITRHYLRLFTNVTNFDYFTGDLIRPARAGVHEKNGRTN